MPPAAGPGDAPATIALLQAHSLSSLVQREIERLILSGELGPGAKLTEADLALRLGVSRGPVREAFRVLEESGLVQLEKNRGVFVRSVPLDEAMEIFEMRALIDEAAGRRLAGQLKPEQARALRAQVEQMERLARQPAGGETGPGSDRSDEYHRLNLAFHDTLVGFTGNRKLLATYRRLVNELSLFRRANLESSLQIAASAAEHRGIVKALVAGDAEAAGRALREHVLGSQQRTLRRHQPAVALPAAPAPEDNAAPAQPAAVRRRSARKSNP